MKLTALSRGRTITINPDKCYHHIQHVAPSHPPITWIQGCKHAQHIHSCFILTFY